jgi:DNA mismatch repair protein MutS2
LDEDVLDALEFPQVLQLLVQEAVTPPGRAAAAAVRPSADPEVVASECELTLEADLYLKRRGHLPFGIVPDVDPILDRLAVDGAVLAPLEVLDILGLLKSARGVKSELTACRPEFPRLWDQARDLPELGNLTRFLDGKIAPSGELEDHASDDLRAVRQDLRRRNEQLRKVLDTIVARPEVTRALQEDFVSLRSERHVIPIRSEARGALHGIVHGVSGSGATVYVEPLETVELNNGIVTLKDQETEEVRRLLREYTELLRSRLAEIRAVRGIVGRLDLLMARARLGRSMHAVPAAIAQDGALGLEGARHPLLEAGLCSQGGRIVPLDLSLAGETRVLVISGPNTGGKTVALKTVGLLCLMAQSGMLVPADGARLPLFRRISIDIGDRQSIQDGLSTFSARMKNVAVIVRKMEPPALTLLDEVGTGTDPEEGVALAIAIIDHFRRLGATVIATTHLEPLKAYAASTPGCANAAMQFDATGSVPTYRLAAGVPGRSGGLEIAEKLGLPAAILDAARALRGDEGRRVEEYLARLEEMSRELTGRLRAADDERSRLERERADLLADLVARERRQRLAVAAEVELALRNLREEGERYLESLTDRELSLRMRREEAKAAAPLRAEARRILRDLGAKQSPDRAPLPAIRPGSKVRIEGVGVDGVVESIVGDRMIVMARGKRLTVPRADCLIASAHPGGPEGSHPLPAGVTLHRRPQEEASADLHLRGRTVDDAMVLVDKFLDDAYLANLSPVRLVHGVGSGRLRKAILDLLEKHPHVEGFEGAHQDEGGQGVTIVRLKL